MAVDRGTPTNEAPETDDAVANDESPERPGLSRGAQFATGAVLAVLVGWFLYAWLARDLSPADAAGESIGTGLVLLIVISVLGAIRRGRRR
jgi:hypothetical protein